jgi:NitT/TauT family transport system substrate-binding protein
MNSVRGILNRILKTIAALALLAGSFACEKRASTGEGPVQSITICQWGQALIYLPLYIAQHEHLFEKQGLRVNLINGGADDLTWAAVTSGNAQFGIADPVMVAIQAEQGGVPGKVVGNVVSKVAFWAVTLDKSMPFITSPAQFKGQKVAAFKYPNTAHALALRTFAKGNLTVGKDVEMVEVNPGAVLAQLQSGNASMAMVLEPAASIAEKEGARIVYSYPQVWGDFAFTGLTVTEKYAAEHGEIVQKVVNALEEAIGITRSDPARTLAAAQKAFPDIEKIILERAIQRMLTEGTIPAHITPSEEGWRKALEVCVEVGKLKKMPPNPESLLDKSFSSKLAR